MNQPTGQIEHIAECDAAEFNDELMDEALDRCETAGATHCTAACSIPSPVAEEIPTELKPVA